MLLSRLRQNLPPIDMGGPRGVVQAGVPRGVDQAGGLSGVNQAGVPRGVDQAGVPRGVDHAGVPRGVDHALSCWFIALPFLFIVAAFAMRQIDIYPATVDEFFSLFNAGWLSERDYAPADVVDSLRRYSPDHAPLYFILLNVWGKLVGHTLAAARILTVLTGVLAMAAAYRLARDFIAPSAGPLMLLVLVSNAFYNYYIAGARMYPLMLLLSGAVLWLYLRMTERATKPTPLDYLALGVSVFCLISAHVFSALFIATLGVFHLFRTERRSSWWRISLTVIVAVALFMPYLSGMLGDVDALTQSKAHVAVGASEAIKKWLHAFSNGQLLLPLLSAIGLGFAIHRRLMQPRAYFAMFILFLLALGIAAEMTSLVLNDSMRHHLAGWLPYALFITAGLYALTRLRRWLMILALAWLAAGIAFQASASWWHFVVLRSLVFTQPPTHILSRLVLGSDPRPALIGYPYDKFYAPFALDHEDNKGYSQREHYFTRHGIDMNAAGELANFDDFARRASLHSPLLWHFQPAATARAKDAVEALESLRYQPCNSFNVGVDTLITEFMWRALECKIPAPSVDAQSDDISYRFYRFAVDIDAAELRFIDDWRARSDRELSALRLSHQLIDADQQRVAGLDLPLVHEGGMRRFAIDISALPPGGYQLMLILYDSVTGERQSWSGNPGAPADMFPLTEIVIT